MKISHLSDIKQTTTSHNQKIWKKVLVGAGQIPNITQYAVARLLPGQVVEQHAHQDIFEVFYVVEGAGKVVVNEEEYLISSGTVFVIEPNDVHGVENTGERELILQYFGVKK